MFVNDRSMGIQLVLATKTVTILTEDLVYPFPSFLAEFGGALGLFLGFSFMMLIEFFVMIAQKCIPSLMSKTETLDK